MPADKNTRYPNTRPRDARRDSPDQINAKIRRGHLFSSRYDAATAVDTEIFAAATAVFRDHVTRHRRGRYNVRASAGERGVGDVSDEFSGTRKREKKVFKTQRFMLTVKTLRNRFQMRYTAARAFEPSIKPTGFRRVDTVLTKSLRRLACKSLTRALITTVCAVRIARRTVITVCPC